MKSRKGYFSCLYLIVILYLFMTFTMPCLASVDGLVGWYHGTTGYENALANAKKKETPLIVFFYLELDRYCQKLGNVYFRAYDVYSYLQDIPKVDINLGGNEFELALAEEFNINNDPALLITFPFYYSTQFWVEFIFLVRVRLSIFLLSITHACDSNFSI